MPYIYLVSLSCGLNHTGEQGGAVAQKDENTATTLFIGNVPQGLTAERAAKALDSLGLKDTYDFFFFKVCLATRFSTQSVVRNWNCLRSQSLFQQTCVPKVFTLLLT